MDELKELLQNAFPNIDFDTEKELVDSGLLDSVALVGLIAEIEQKYDIEVPMEYIQPDYFQSIETIWNMIEELK